MHLSDSKGYLVDEDGFDYMKISLLRDIKAQQRSLRFVSILSFIYASYWQIIHNFMVLVHKLVYVETIRRPMLGPNITMKRNPGMKGVILHLPVLHRMKLINLMQ